VFFSGFMKHPKTHQSTSGLFGRPVLAHLGPTKPAETRRAGVELKRLPPLAFLSGDAGDERRPVRRAGRRRRRHLSKTLPPPPLLEDDAAAAALSSSLPRRHSLWRAAPSDAPPTLLPPSTWSSCRRPSSSSKLEIFVMLLSLYF
jgi:hypothetical protein